jgi:hypothetical protein
MAHSELRIWMRMGVLALVMFISLREITRVHLLVLRLDEGSKEEEKEELKRLLQMSVLVILGKPR